jgi:predicted Zn-dependent protease
VIRKRFTIALLALLLSACVSSAPPPDIARHADSDSDSAESESTPAESPKVPEAESKPEGGESGESSAKPDGRPGRIVLDTVYDDRRVGEDQTAVIEAELGVVDDPKLLEYLRSVGIRLVRYAPPRPFDYEFKIVDQSVPNAFALPGGKIYVSRGLLALVDTEDELAGVLGHEITHAAERHAAAQLDYSSRLNPFSIGLFRAAAIAAYGRDQERDADRGGQILAGQAGYDPMGIAIFLRKLDASDRYEIGWSRLPNFLATHPSSPERSALASNRAQQISWERKPEIASDLPDGYFSEIDGLVVGDNPAGGLFDGSRFVHPDLRFTIRFPQGWTTMNSQQAVGAVSPAGDAQTTLTVEGRGTDVDKVVDDFLARDVDGIHIHVTDRQPIRIGDLSGTRIEGRASIQGVGLYVQMTFLVYDGLVYRLSLMSLSGAASRYRGRARAFAHSFRPLDDAGAHSLEVTRLRIARARENETLEQLSLRTHNALELVYTGVLNGLYASSPLTRGERIKIGLAEPYLPKPKEVPAPATEPGAEKAEPRESGGDGAKPVPER